MAVTLNNVRRKVTGDGSVEILGTCVGPASYTTGGEVLSAAQIKILTDGDSTTALTAPSATTPGAPIEFESETEPANLRSLVLDRANKKMKFVAGATEVANLTNLSAVFVNFRVVTKAVNQPTATY